MEPKCNFCDFFGEKQHCHNCKVFNKTRTHIPQKITCSLKELVGYINSHEDISEKYGVGDYKVIELYTGEKVKMILLDINKDKLSGCEGNARATFGIMSFDGLYKMNPTNTNEGSWENSEMRTVRMERILRLLPSQIRDNIKPVIKYTTAGGGSKEIIATTDKCFLFSEIEIRGEIECSYSGEGDQYEYFILAENRNFDNRKWLRSPYSGNSSSFCYVSGSGSADWSNASNNYGVALGFCI